MESLRVQSGIVIEVNDDGETITVPVADGNFAERFYGLYDLIHKNADGLRVEAVTDLSEREQLLIMIKKMNEITSEIDNMFGEGCCRKVFGDISPAPILLIEFLDQLTPIVQKYIDEKQQKIKKIEDKYTPKNRQQKRSRKGS